MDGMSVWFKAMQPTNWVKLSHYVMQTHNTFQEPGADTLTL